MTELAARYGLVATKVQQRLRLGWTAEQAVGIKPRVRQCNTGRPLTHDGISYGSLAEASRALGLDPLTVAARVSKGYSPEDALNGNLKGRSSHRSKSIEFRGQEYGSREELCRQFGQKWGNVLRRMNRGWTMEQALMLEPAPPRFRNHEGHARDHKWKEVRINEGLVEPVPDSEGFKLYVVTNTVNGKQYVGLTMTSLGQRLKQHFAAAKRGRKSAFSNALRKYGVDAFTISLIRSDAQSYAALQQQEVEEIERRDCIRNGYNTAKGGAIGTSKETMIAGKVFPSFAAAAEAYAIDPSVFALRLNRLKWSPEEAAGLVEREWEGKAQPVTIAGVEYTSLYNAASSLGVDYKLVHNRTHARGWTLEQAVGLSPPPEAGKYSGEALEVFGEQYGSIGEAARALGVNVESFRKRIRDGMTPEEAFRRARVVRKISVAKSVVEKTSQR
ncbi:GIY-YIG nuclease family protein [Hydrogenophaga sp.]|uniref:GIY-YIG nuclease family protein n=1 Tax=Hydrogenophaga sp. TaxID=1904254 RepID=UPI0027321F6D|nr:GIY-YIG nuclease family protein [Hydrogenophaga sp.]MDP1686476.1 GIY-YIG nuclease family protein [Hydrogenophaga sp.]